MTRKEQLLSKLKETPTDKTAFDNLLAFFIQRGDFEGLYASLSEVVESLRDPELLREFRGRVREAVRKHAELAPEPLVEAGLKVRMARAMFEAGEEPGQALVLMTEALERVQSEEAAQKTMEMLKAGHQTLLLLQLLEYKAAGEEGAERKNDTLMQFAYAALAAQEVARAEEAFRELAAVKGGIAEKAAEGLKQVAKARSELQSEVTRLEAAQKKGTDEERLSNRQKLGHLYVRLGRLGEGIKLLEEVLERNRKEDVFRELFISYKRQDRWSELVRLVDTWLETVDDAETRKELLKERARVQAVHLGDRSRASESLTQLYDLYPGTPDVVDFCVNILGQLEDYEGMAEFLKRARQDTKDRDQERRFLEWEAALRWRKLDQADQAEKLYRRIKSIDPRNEASLVFYEEIYREEGNFRKLYSVLSTRQSLVPDMQKVEILKEMARISRQELESPDRAIDALRKIQVLDPDDEEAFEELGQLLEDSGRWHAVVEHYSGRVERLSDSQNDEKLRLLERVREIYASQDKLPVPEMVVNIDRRILQVDGSHRRALSALEEHYRKNNRWPELADVLSRRAENERDRKVCLQLHKEIARILVEYQHQEAQAIPHLERVVELDDRDGEVLSLLSRAYRTRGNVEGFLKIGRRRLVLSKRSERRELLEELATVSLEQAEQGDDAIEFLEALYDLDASHPWAFRRLRKAYEQTERHVALAALYSRQIETTTLDNVRRELKEKLGALLADRLDRLEEARTLFEELLAENPTNRQARKYLQNILAQAGDFAELEETFRSQNNLAGLLRFLDEFRRQEKDPERIKRAGLEMVRVARDELHDAVRAERIMDGLLEQLPLDLEVARKVLEGRSDASSEASVVRALSVLADHGEGLEAQKAALTLTEVLESSGELLGAYTRTLGLFLLQAQDGDLSLLDSLVERAAKAETLPDLAETLEGMVGQELPSGAAALVGVKAGEIQGHQIKDTQRAEQVLNRVLEHDPDCIPALVELEKLYSAAGNWASFEAAVRAHANLLMDVGEKTEELFKLARLYEEIVMDLERAAEVYQEVLELAPDSPEASLGLKRVLEELERWDELVLLLEEELNLSRAESAPSLMLELARLYWTRLDQADKAAEHLERLVTAWPEDEPGWELVEELVRKREGLDTLLPLLELRLENQGRFEDLVELLNLKAETVDNDIERYEVLDRCAGVLETQLVRPAAAFQYLVRMVSLDSSDPELVERLDAMGRQSRELDALLEVYKGLLGIGEARFEPKEALDSSVELQVSVNLAHLAHEMELSGVAIEALKRARNWSPSDRSLMDLLDRLLEAEERFGELYELLEEKVELVHESQERKTLLLRIADLLASRLGREEDSVIWVEKVLEASGEDLEVMDRLEGLYLGLERFEELAELLDRKKDRVEESERVSVLYQLAVVYRDHLGDYDRALSTLQTGLREDPDSDLVVEALRGMLDGAMQQGQELVARRVAEVLEPLAERKEDWQLLADVLQARAALTQDSRKRGEVWLRLGRVLRDELESPDLAFEALSHAVEEDPGEMERLRELIVLSFELKRRSELMDTLEKGLGDIEQSEAVPALAAYGAALQEDGARRQDAANVFERLVQLVPENLDYAWTLEGLYEEMGKPEDRIRVLAEVVERLSGPEQAQTLVDLAALQVEVGDTDGAIPVLHRAVAQADQLEEDPRHLAFHLLLDALEKEESWFEMSQVLDRQLSYARDLGERKALLYRAALIEEERLESLDHAVERFKAIVELDGSDREAVGSLVRLLDMAGRFLELEQFLTHRCDQEKDDEERKRLTMQLVRLRLESLDQSESALDALEDLVQEGGLDEEVVELVRGIMESHPDSGYRASLLLEQMYRQQEDFEALAELYRHQIQEYPHEVDAVELYRQLATLYEEHFDDIEQAMEAICEAFRREPESQAIHDQMVSYARKKDSFEDLFQVYVEVLASLDETRARNQLRRKMAGIYHDEIGDLEHAEFIYRDMVDDDPENSFALEHLEALFRETEQWEKLIDILRTRLDSTRTDAGRVAILFDIAAVSRDKMEELAEALDVYEELLIVDPRQWDAYRAIENIHFHRGDMEGVAATLRRELVQHESSQERLELRIRLAGLLFRELEDFEAALVEIRTLLSEGQDQEETLALLEELVQRWESPSQDAVAILDERYRADDDWERVIDLYQHAANGALALDEKLAWMKRIYEVRVESQKDGLGAYAVCKNASILVPAETEWLVSLAQHAVEVDKVDDAVTFLQARIESDEIAGGELEPHYRFVQGGLQADAQGNLEAAAETFRAVTLLGPSLFAGPARHRLKDILESLERWDEFVEVAQELAQELTDREQRRDLLAQAAQVASETLGQPEVAEGILSGLAVEFPEDVQLLDNYERLLVELEKGVELEQLLRRRIDISASKEERGEVRARLGNLLLGSLDRLGEGIEELMLNLEDEVLLEASWNMLESVMDSDATPDAERLEIARGLASSLEKHGEVDRVIHALEVLLGLESDESDRNRAHLRLAVLHRERGESSEEFIHLGQSLRLFPGDRTVEEALEKLAGEKGLELDLRDLLQEVAEISDAVGLKLRYLEQAARLSAAILDDAESAAVLQERILELDEYHLEALVFLEDYFGAQGEPEKVAPLLERRVALEADPARRQAVTLKLARLLTGELGDGKAARTWWEELRHESTSADEAYRSLAAICEEEGDHEALVDLLLEQFDGAGDDGVRNLVARRLGEVYETSLEHLSEAGQWYRRAAELKGDDRPALDGWRRCAAAEEDVDSLAVADEALLAVAEPSLSIELQKELAVLLIDRLARKQEGLQYLQSLLVARPLAEGVLALAQSRVKDPDVGFQLSLALEPVLDESGDYQGLAELLNVQLEGIEEPEQRTTLLLRQSQVLSENLGQGPEAVEALREVLSTREGLELAEDALWDIGERHGVWNEVAAVLEEESMETGDPEHLVALCLAVGRLRVEHLADPDGAATWFRRVLEESPGHEAAVSELERLYEGTEQFAELAAFYEDLLLDADGEARIPLLLKWGFLKEGQLGDLVGSIQAYKEVLMLSPENLAALNRLDGMLDNPVLGLAAIETLEPIYRAQQDDLRLARLLKAKAAEVEGSLDRSALLGEAAQRLNGVEGMEIQAFETYLQAIREKSFDPEEIVSPAGDLAEELGRWEDLATALEEALPDNPHGEIRQEIRRRLALTYIEKLRWLTEGEEKLREVLAEDPDNAFALHLLVRVMELKGDDPGRCDALERLGDTILDSHRAREHFLEAAQLAMEGSHIEIAARLLHKALRLSPEDMELMEQLAGTYRMLERWPDLVELLEGQAQLSSPDDAATTLLEGAHLSLEKLEDAGRALALARLVLDRDPENSEALELSAQILKAQGRVQELTLIMERLVDLRSGGARLETLFDLVEICRQADDLDGAMANVDRILEEAPENERAQALRMELLSGSNDLHSLVAAYEQRAEKEKDPARQADLYIKAVDLLVRELNDLDGAMEVLARLRERVPEHHGALDRQARIALQLKEFQKAVEYLEERARLEPDLETRGRTLLQAARLAVDELRELELAEIYAREAMEALPEDAEVTDVLVKILEKLERFDDLADLLDRQFQEEASPEKRSQLARKLAAVHRFGMKDEDGFVRWMETAHETGGDLETVSALMEHATAVGDKDGLAGLMEWKIAYLVDSNQNAEVPELLLQLGQLREEQGDAEGAMAAYQRCVLLDGSFLPGMYKLGVLLAGQPERVEEAVALFQKLLLRINELGETQQRADVYYHLAVIYRAKGDTKRAKGYVARLLSVDRNHAAGSELKKELDQ